MTDFLPICLLLFRARAGGSELAQMAALLGGIAGQEAVKLITRQYIPLSGTVVFDGIKSRTGVVSTVPSL
jgi:amyloid beta precursor protein binding protein 1